MVGFIKKYWVESLVFGAVFAVLLIDCAPNMTWMNTDSDGIHDLYAAKYLYLSHKTSMPLYLLIGHLFTRIPFGTDFWNLALLSVFATIGACVFIYLLIREHLKDNPKSRWYAMIGVLVYGGSALVISQSTIVETYALITMLGIGAYYYYLKQGWKRCALMLGLGLAVHPLAGLTLIVLFVFGRELRRWKPILIVSACLLLYLYFPLSTILRPEQPDMWGNRTFADLIRDMYGTYQFLFASLAIYDLPKRILDTIGIIGVSLGLACIPIGWYLHRNKKRVMFYLFVLPIVMFIIGLPPQTYVYCMPSIAIGAVITGVALAKMKREWAVSVLVVATLLLGFNAYYFDIGRTLDPELSATKYYEQLEKVPDGAILMPKQGWEWAAIFPYNKNEDRGIRPVAVNIFISETYQQYLIENGVKFEDNYLDDRIERENYLALSVIRLNDNVWITKTTTPETYGCEIIPARGNEMEIVSIPTEPPGRVHWKPSNPYQFITGALEVKEWVFITMSNWSVGYFGGLAAVGLILNWLLFILPKKRVTEYETILETTEKTSQKNQTDVHDLRPS